MIWLDLGSFVRHDGVEILGMIIFDQETSKGCSMGPLGWPTRSWALRSSKSIVWPDLGQNPSKTCNAIRLEQKCISQEYWLEQIGCKKMIEKQIPFSKHKKLLKSDKNSQSCIRSNMVWFSTKHVYPSSVVHFTILKVKWNFFARISETRGDINFRSKNPVRWVLSTVRKNYAFSKSLI